MEKERNILQKKWLCKRKYLRTNEYREEYSLNMRKRVKNISIEKREEEMKKLEEWEDK